MPYLRRPFLAPARTFLRGHNPTRQPDQQSASGKRSLPWTGKLHPQPPPIEMTKIVRRRGNVTGGSKKLSRFLSIVQRGAAEKCLSQCLVLTVLSSDSQVVVKVPISYSKSSLLKV